MEYDDEMHYVMFSASDIGYDPSHNLCVWVYAYISMKGVHGSVQIYIRDYFNNMWVYFLHVLIHFFDI